MSDRISTSLLRRRKGPFLFAAFLLATATASAAATETLTVVMNSGARYSGTLDPLTDARLLWLRHQRGSMQLRRPLDWNAIRQIEVAGRTLTSEELRANHADYVRPAERKLRGPSRGARGAESPAPSEDAKVVTLRIDATAANWDADVENDGILLQLAPLGTEGELVPVSGTLEVELIGQGPSTANFPQSFPVLARWARKVSPAEMTPQGYTWRLDYQAWQPEFDLQLGASAMVHARLVVPGSGALEASTPTINVRPFNPLRDQLQMQRTGRFFPSEQTGVGKHP